MILSFTPRSWRKSFEISNDCGVEQAAFQWMESCHKRKRPEPAARTPKPQDQPDPLVSASELPAQDRLAQGHSTPSCRAGNAADSRCKAGCCSNCANPACSFPRGFINVGQRHPKFRVINNEAVCNACHCYYSKNGCMKPAPQAPQQAISRHDPKCRADNPADSRCKAGCCSDCANQDCSFPRGALNGFSQQVMFQSVAGKIVCGRCAGYFKLHGIWRTDAAVSEAVPARMLRLQQHNSAATAARKLMLQQLGPQRLKHWMKELDPDYSPARRTGESAWWIYEAPGCV